MSGFARLSVLGLLAVVGLSACGGGGDSVVTLQSIQVTPATPSAIAGATLQLTATGNYSDGGTKNLTGSASWTSSTQSVATINSAGLATAVAPGGATLTATFEGVIGSAQVTMVSPAFAGSAAAGAPLAGTVTVKDSLGATRTSTIGANGSYSVDVWGLTPPLVLRAEGTAGSTHYVIHSAATTIGLGGTLNITPLTELIIDNIAGQIAATYFDNGNFGGLTQPLLDAESAALKAKLLPVLQALGVSASVDLLRTPFTPGASALDSALDVLRVTVNATTHLATILNVVNQTSITDDIAVPAAGEGTTPPLSAEGTTGAGTDLDAIRKVLADFMALYKNDITTVSAITPLFSDTFLHDDQNGPQFADEINDARELVGGSITDITVSRLDYAYNGGVTPLATISFTLRDKNGLYLNRLLRFTMLRGIDGKWRMHGNRSVLEFSLNVHQVKDIKTGCKASGLEFQFDDRDAANSSTIVSVLILGWGLPTFQGAATGFGAVWFDRNAQTGKWKIRRPPNRNQGWYPMTGECNNSWADEGLSEAIVAAIPEPAIYTAVAYNASTVEVPLSAYTGAQYGGATQQLIKRPSTLAELNASTLFPTFTTSSLLSTFSGGSLTINVANASPQREAWVYLGLTAGGLTNSVDTEAMPAANGTFGRTLTLSSPGGAITQREIRVATSDEFDRTYMTLENYVTPAP